MRYRGQSFELEIRDDVREISRQPFIARIENVTAMHRKRVTIEIVSARLRSLGLVDKPAKKRIASSRRRGNTKPQT